MAQSQLKKSFLNKKHYSFFLKKNRRKRNPIAKILNVFTPKIIPDKTKYDRKKNKNTF
jgi:hypothetical protein